MRNKVVKHAMQATSISQTSNIGESGVFYKLEKGTWRNHYSRSLERQLRRQPGFRLLATLFRKVLGL